MEERIDISDEEHKSNLAFFYTNSLGLSASTITELVCASRADGPTFIEPLRDQIRKLIDGGPRESEIMLASNVLTLNVLANTMLQKGARAQTIKVMKAYMDIALRAQDQMRKTILAMEQMKNPKQNTFVAQQNIATVQQVNNALPQEGKISNSENELLSEETYETLEQRGANETIAINQEMGALETINRTNKPRGA